ncbi:hypothetical protein QQF64_034443 [Cirrhinus molitorella]|uniref:Retrotransposon gag domain-containing protein n=1 Tax=Cirrhinus molitorella TaxID=172907 RepID=A0ABR3L4P7_9TELE
MESAGSDQIRAAVVQQGVLLGQHATRLTETTRGVETMSSQITELTNQVRELMRDQDSLRSAAAVSAQTPVLARVTPEPRVPNPPPYDGDPKACRPFLSQCAITFTLQPTTFATEAAKVAFVITLLTGKAREWGTTVWEKQAPYCATFELFRQEMIKVFDRSVAGKEAASQLVRLRQGESSVTDFSIQFRTLAVLCGWNEAALWDVFREGLNPEIQDEIAIHDLPASFDDLVELALRVETRIDLRRQRIMTHSSWPTTLRPVSEAATARPESLPDVEPMQSSPIDGELLVSITPLSSSPACRTQLPAIVKWGPFSRPCYALVDSGAEGNFVDASLVARWGIPTTPLKRKLIARALNDTILTQVTHVTSPVSLTVSGNHSEDIAFYLLESPGTPIVLGHPWLVRHSPHIGGADCGSDRCPC